MTFKIFNIGTLVLAAVLILIPIVLPAAINFIEEYKINKKIAIINNSPSANIFSKEFSVSSTQPWQDTGISIKTGDAIIITASGTVQFDTAGRKASPDGEIPQSENPFGIVLQDGTCLRLLCGDNIPKISLVGRIGTPDLRDFREGFFVGSDFTMVADRYGELWLGVDDEIIESDRSGLGGGVGDNSGAFNVKITVIS